MRSQCIEQLNRWHTLLEKGRITKGQYDGLQATILKDMQLCDGKINNSCKQDAMRLITDFDFRTFSTIYLFVYQSQSHASDYMSLSVTVYTLN